MVHKGTLDISVFGLEKYYDGHFLGGPSGSWTYLFLRKGIKPSLQVWKVFQMLQTFIRSPQKLLNLIKPTPSKDNSSPFLCDHNYLRQYGCNKPGDAQVLFLRWYCRMVTTTSQYSNKQLKLAKSHLYTWIVSQMICCKSGSGIACRQSSNCT